MKRSVIFVALYVFIYTSYAQTIVWKQLASLPTGYRNGEAVAVNGKIYFVTGYNVSGGYSNRDFYMYNPATNLWSKMANLPYCKVNSAVAEVNGKVYAIGGDRVLNTNYVYSPETNTWDILNSMPTGRQHIDCSVYKNKIYVIGGLDTWTGNDGTITKKNEVFDVLNNSWSEKSEIPSLRNYPAIVTLDSQIYVIGGGGSAASIWTHTAKVECYNISADRWEQKADLPYVLFGPATVVVSNQIVVLGGGTMVNGEDVFTNKVLIYRKGTDRWIETTPLPDIFGSFACTSIGNKIYVIGGMKFSPPNSNNYTTLSTVYEGELMATNVQESQQNKIQIYPNPSNNKIIIKNLDGNYL